eukprot:g2012.t1
MSHSKFVEQIKTAKQLASQQPEEFKYSISTEDAGESVVERFTGFSKKYVPCNVSVGKGFIEYSVSVAVFFNKTKKHSLADLVSVKSIGTCEFRVVLSERGSKRKEINFRCRSNEDMNRWKTCILLNADLHGPQDGAPPDISRVSLRDAEKCSSSGHIGGSDNGDVIASSSKVTATKNSTSMSRSDGPLVPTWLLEANKNRGPANWTREGYSACLLQAKSHTPDVLEFAISLRRMSKSLKFAEGWPWALWGVDVVQCLIESFADGGIAAHRSNVASPTFFMSLLTINGKVMEKEKLYNRVVDVFDDYRRTVVLPFVRSASGVELVRAFVKRWELYKIFSEYMRRIFIDLDKNTDGKSRPTVSSIALRNFAKLFEFVKDRLIATVLEIINEHRQSEEKREVNGDDEDNYDVETRKCLKQCCEILCVMGVLDSSHVDKIRFLISPSDANAGRFLVMSQLELIEEGSSAVPAATTICSFTCPSPSLVEKIVVADHLGFYETYFEDAFVDTTRTYYERQCATWLSKKSVPDYMRCCLRAYDRERARVEAYLHPSSTSLLLRCCVCCMFASSDGNMERRLVKDVDTGLMALLCQKKFKDAATFYTAFRLSEKHLPPRNNDDDGDDGDDATSGRFGLELSASVFGEWIKSEAENLRACRARKIRSEKKRAGARYAPSSSDPRYVECLLHISRECAKIRRECFQGGALFQKESNLAFESVLNKAWIEDRKEADVLKPVSIEIILVEYFHMVLVTGKNAKGARQSTEEKRRMCFEIFEIFEHLYAKDVFVEHYRTRLQDRALSPKYNQFVFEREILGRLKMKIGQVHRMEVILKDAIDVKESQRKWSRYLENERDGGGARCPGASSSKGRRALHPVVVTDTSWDFGPSNLSSSLKIPSKISQALNAFAEYYKSCHDSRMLEFRHDLSHVVLDYTCPMSGEEVDEEKKEAPKKKKTYQVSMIAPQACLLLLFNKDKALTLNDIRTSLGTDALVTRSLLMTLLMRPARGCPCGLIKKRLRKGRKPLPLLDDDVFELSMNFANARKAFALKRPLFAPKSSGTEKTKDARMFRLEAAMVRLMKTNRIMSERELIQEAMDQVSKFFKPGVLLAKRVLESLIRREYMKRSDEDRSKLCYLA